MVLRRRLLSLMGGVLVLGVALAVAGTGTVQAAETCQTGHPVTFTNKSGEQVFIGVFGVPFDSDDQQDKPFQGYPGPGDWVLGKEDGSSLTWCAPSHFNGRFFARTGCSDGKCRTGDCCAGKTCSGNVCTKGPDPTTLAEVFFDSKAGTYYDVSFVDGYDFPLLMKPKNTGANQCKDAGCYPIPDCPWPMLDGVCTGPYKQFEIDYQDYQYRPEYYPLGAKCAKSGNDVCGCGFTIDCKKAGKTEACPNSLDVPNPYKNNAPVTLVSGGCSPINENYDNQGQGNGNEKYQIACDPTKPDSTPTHYNTQCHPWPAFYKKYVQSILDACKDQGVYTWQYSDTAGGRDCANTADFGFDITIMPRKKSGPQQDLITLRPGGVDDKTGTPAVTGAVRDKAGTEYKLLGPNALKMGISGGEELTIRLDCKDPGFSLTCIVSYKSGAGFSVKDGSAGACNDAALFSWDKREIPLSFPATQSCSSSTAYILQVSPAAGVEGHVCIGSDTTAKSFSPKANPPIHVTLQDGDLFRFIQKCGKDGGGKARVLDCSAAFSLKNGFTPQKIDGQSSYFTGNINWADVFKGKNLGLADFPNAAAVEANCVVGAYKEECPGALSVQDAESALSVQGALPTDHDDPLKLDHNKDGKIDFIDSIMILRHSQGL